ncbi:MAG: ankyrin repeat protein [Flavobacteriaceae bacterium]|jgi:ankyrin repeat protein
MPSNLILGLLLCFSITTLGQGVFDIARSGDAGELKTYNKLHPNNLNKENDQGYTPLMLAAYHGNVETATYLVDQGADLNGESKYGTPIMAAAIKGNIDVVRLLLSQGADLNKTDSNGTTALLYTSIFSLNEIAELLLKGGADPKLKDNKGNTALDYAILTQNETLIKLLNLHQ